MRKVYVTLEIKTIIEMDDGVDLREVIDDMDYELVSMTDGAEILDTEVMDYIVEDSK